MIDQKHDRPGLRSTRIPGPSQVRQSRYVSIQLLTSLTSSRLNVLPLTAAARSFLSNATSAPDMPSSPTTVHSTSTQAVANHLSVAIVDDHPAIREALRRTAESRMSMEVVAEAGSNEEALRLIKEHSPDVAVLDLVLRDGQSFSLIETLRAERPETGLLVFSMCDEAIYAERVLRGGASGYIMKPAGTEAVLKAAKRVGDGKMYLSSEMTTRVLLRAEKGSGKEIRFPIDELTSKELDVFKMVGRGMTAGAIADQLGLARKTVETHRREAKEKLGYETIHEVTSHAARWVQAGVQAEEQANPA